VDLNLDLCPKESENLQNPGLFCTAKQKKKKDKTEKVAKKGQSKTRKNNKQMKISVRRRKTQASETRPSSALRKRPETRNN